MMLKVCGGITLLAVGIISFLSFQLYTLNNKYDSLVNEKYRLVSAVNVCNNENDQLRLRIRLQNDKIKELSIADTRLAFETMERERLGKMIDTYSKLEAVYHVDKTCEAELNVIYNVFKD